MSPPNELVNATHQTSPRFIGEIPERVIGPLRRLGFSSLLLGHPAISGLEVLSDDVRADQRLDESADLPPPDDAVQPFVDTLIQRDGQLLLHGALDRKTRIQACIIG